MAVFEIAAEILQIAAALLGIYWGVKNFFSGNDDDGDEGNEDSNQKED